MTPLLINIRGCNGSGKSTIPMSMMDDPDMFIIEKPFQGKNKKILTVFPKYKTVVLGTYFNKTGGCDGLNNTKLVMKRIQYAIRQFPEYDVLFEGVIISTVYSTWKDFFEMVTSSYPDRKVVILNLLPPLEVCLDRIQKRTGKPIKEELVASKWRSVQRNHEKFKSDGLNSFVRDNSDIDVDETLRWFKIFVDKKRKQL